MLNRAGEYVSYAGCTEIVKGVYVSDDADVYIHDVEGEVVSWLHEELTDPTVAADAIKLIILAAKRGSSAVRLNAADRGTTLGQMIKHAQWAQGR